MYLLYRTDIPVDEAEIVRDTALFTKQISLV